MHGADPDEELHRGLFVEFVVEGHQDLQEVLKGGLVVLHVLQEEVPVFPDLLLDLVSPLISCQRQ